MSNNPFIHEEVYRGKDALKKIANTRLVVCGCGALGSLFVDTMCRQGYSKLTAIDFDRVEIHNLNTQLYGLDDVGKVKTAVLQQKIYASTKVAIDVFQKKLDSTNVEKALKQSDIVVDLFDNVESRSLVHKYTLKNNIDCIHAGVVEYYSEVVWNEQYRIPDSVKGKKNDVLEPCELPLARNLITFTVSLLAEEIQSYVCNPRHTRRSFNFTLGDLKVGSYK